MRSQLIALIGIALIVGACRDFPDVAADRALDVAPSTSPTTIGPAPVEPRDAQLPADRDVDDIVFEPVPVPVEPPAPKPQRGLPTPPPNRSGPPAVPPPVDEPVVEEALSNLADRLGIGIDVIDVLDARAVTWRDGSVGCPEPGLAYSQALVPGWLVVLRVDDGSFRYHASENRHPFFCATPEAPLEGAA